MSKIFTFYRFVVAPHAPTYPAGEAARAGTFSAVVTGDRTVAELLAGFDAPFLPFGPATGAEIAGARVESDGAANTLDSLSLRAGDTMTIWGRAVWTVTVDVVASGIASASVPVVVFRDRFDAELMEELVADSESDSADEPGLKIKPVYRVRLAGTWEDQISGKPKTIRKHIRWSGELTLGLFPNWAAEASGGAIKADHGELAVGMPGVLMPAVFDCARIDEWKDICLDELKPASATCPDRRGLATEMPIIVFGPRQDDSSQHDCWVLYTFLANGDFWRRRDRESASRAGQTGKSEAGS